jgi:asparagine synthase (glutamine-hydrolysing)
LDWGFSLHCGPSGCELQLYAPVSSPSRPPLVTWFASPDICVALIGRLYYTSGWRQKPGALPAADEAGFAAGVYQDSGAEGLQQLEGDFALVLVDLRARRILALRDPMGAYPLYWSAQGETFLISTGMRPHLDRLPSWDLNLDYVADYLLVAGSQSELPSEACVYQGVRRLRPATMLSWHAASREVSCHAYWNWLERLADPGTETIAEAGRLLRQVLTEAVRERLCGRTASHLSGGMDSTAIALLAREASAERAPVHAISLVYRRLEALRRESPYVEAALAHAPDLVPHIIEGDDFLDFDSFRNPPTHDEPYPGLWRLGMDRALIEAALEADAVTLLTGLGADEILDMQPYHVADLIRRGHVWHAWQESCAWAYAMQWNVWQVFFPFGLANVFPAWTRVGSGQLLRRRSELAKDNAWALPPWILPSFARRYGLRDRASENARHTYLGCKSASLSVAMDALVQRAGNAISWSLAAPRGLLITHPFFDTRVVRLGLGIITRVAPKPEPLKPVLAAAIGDLLPESIRSRRSKGHFNELYYLGLSRNSTMLEAMITRAPSDELGLVDKKALIEHLYKAALGGAGVRPLQHFNLMVAMLEWLSRQASRRRDPCTPRATHHVAWPDPLVR